MSRLLRLFAALACLSALLVSPAPPASAQTPPAGWREAPVTGGDHKTYCINYFTPFELIMIDMMEQPYLAYNWKTGQSTDIPRTPEANLRARAACEPTGISFRWVSDGAGNATGCLRYSLADSTLTTIDRCPSAVAADGTLRAYSAHKNQLWASSDGGLSWVDRTPGLPGAIQGVVMAEADSRQIYALVSNLDGNPRSFAVYASADAGAAWERRYAGVADAIDTPSGLISAGIYAPRGSATPAGTLLLDANKRLLLSSDGGRTFLDQGPSGNYDAATLIAHTLEGLVKVSQKRDQPSTVELSRDGGRSWETLNAAAPLKSVGESNAYNQSLKPAPSAPQVLVYDVGYAGAYSPDGGRTWRDLTGPGKLFGYMIPPYLPLTLLAWRSTAPDQPSSGREMTAQLMLHDIPVTGAQQTVAAQPTGAPGAAFYPQTGHEMSPLFKPFWERNGGLAQFGYPRTGAFREVNPSNGRIYTVQYFERNRFEHHPEHAGTPYEVELGLLGAQLTSHLRRDPAFQPQSDPTSDAHCTFYPETAHRLCHAFQGYWNAHGGLAVYGYPISETFQENGRTVQYFERARFEWFPEHQGTPYSVQLGLLANELLQSRVWLP